MKKTSSLLTGVGLTLLGFALLGGGGYILKSRMAFYSHSVVNEGTVVEVESSKRNNNTYYHPKITFDAEDGNTYTFTAESSTSSAFDFNQGDKVQIRYTVENPTGAKIDNFLDLWSLPMALLISGLVIFLSGATNVYQSVRRSSGR